MYWFKESNHPLRNYPWKDLPSTLVMIACVYHARLWCGLCGDFALTDLFVALCRDVFLILLSLMWCSLSCCMCPFGTVAVDAPLAGCKRKSWWSGRHPFKRKKHQTFHRCLDHLTHLTHLTPTTWTALQVSDSSGLVGDLAEAKVDPTMDGGLVGDLQLGPFWLVKWVGWDGDSFLLLYL